jgi:hypothetical protein
LIVSFFNNSDLFHRYTVVILPLHRQDTYIPPLEDMFLRGQPRINFTIILFYGSNPSELESMTENGSSNTDDVNDDSNKVILLIQLNMRLEMARD